jgi:hypothetical protein
MMDSCQYRSPSWKVVRSSSLATSSWTLTSTQPSQTLGKPGPPRVRLLLTFGADPVDPALTFLRWGGGRIGTKRNLKWRFNFRSPVKRPCRCSLIGLETAGRADAEGVD